MEEQSGEFGGISFQVDSISWNSEEASNWLIHLGATLFELSSLVNYLTLISGVVLLGVYITKMRHPNNTRTGITSPVVPFIAIFLMSNAGFGELMTDGIFGFSEGTNIMTADLPGDGFDDYLVNFIVRVCSFISDVCTFAVLWVWAKEVARDNPLWFTEGLFLLTVAIITGAVKFFILLIVDAFFPFINLNADWLEAIF